MKVIIERDDLVQAEEFIDLDEKVVNTVERLLYEAVANPNNDSRIEYTYEVKEKQC